jgi:hypothetical protein
VGIVADSAPSRPGRIFISYRRQETAYAAGWLYDRLRDHYGGGQVFKDVDSIELGDDFVEVITRAVGFCDVLLALIGDEWLTITDEQDRRRLDDPDDFVRVEIEAALARKVRVIPILVDGARMPGAKELPASLARLARRQALELNPARFDFDTGRLLRVLDNVLADLRVVEGVPVEAVPDATAEDRPPLAKVVAERQPIPLSNAVPSQSRASQERLREYLVHAAAGDQLLAVAANRGKALGATTEDVELMAKDLARDGLLEIEGSLGPNARLHLKS